MLIMFYSYTVTPIDVYGRLAIQFAFLSCTQQTSCLTLLGPLAVKL